jgi:hypothetical protein
MNFGGENMKLSAIEILAALLIVLTGIKLAVILIDARIWLRFAKRMYAMPAVTSWAALLLAALVLYVLLQSGLTIVQVLAVTVFVALLLMVSVAPYAGRLFGWLETQSVPAMLREQWLYVIVWVLLLAWGTVELLMGS